MTTHIYYLTDGSRILDKKRMTSDEAKYANYQAEMSGAYWKLGKPGGARPGAGRPPKHASGPMKQATVRLPEQWQADLRAEFGSLQAGVETLVKAHREQASSSPALLSCRALVATLVWQLNHPGQQNWLWLCLNDETRQEMLDDAQKVYERWVENELEQEWARASGPPSQRANRTAILPLEKCGQCGHLAGFHEPRYPFACRVPDCQCTQLTSPDNQYRMNDDGHWQGRPVLIP